MAVPSSSRPAATHRMPQYGAHASHAHPQHATVSASSVAQARPPSSPYTPSSRDLEPGPKNRLWLSLHSGIDDEVDYALPRLVLASFERPDLFIFDKWPDSVSALKEWPMRWLAELQQEAAYRKLVRARNGNTSTDVNGVPLDSNGVQTALGAVPALTRNPVVESRATYSLHILRNASFVQANSRAISRSSIMAFIMGFFDLPLDLVLEVATRNPEPVQHILTILQAVYDFLFGSPQVLSLLTEALPLLAMNTRDLGMLVLILPIMSRTFSVNIFPPPPDGFIQHLLYLLTINPPAGLLEIVLDLLAGMVRQPAYARIILGDPAFGPHLKNLVMLLEHGSRPYGAVWEPTDPHRSRPIINPASSVAFCHLAKRRRAIQREQDQRRAEVFGGPGIFNEVADVAPTLPPVLRQELYSMSEPKRSISWMHETFVYSSQAQLLQVTFWHAYRDFFSNPATVEQLLSASEVIKNVQVAFPAAQAKLWTDERGEKKFVIAGLGFRKGAVDEERFTCAWRGCTKAYGATNPGELLDHVQKTHLEPTMPTTCEWGNCRRSPCTLPHILTHIPLADPPAVPDQMAVNPGTPGDLLRRQVITSWPPPRLPPKEPLKFTAQITPVDPQRRDPQGVAFLAALVVRGLARNLHSEVAVARPEEVGLSDEQRREKKKHFMEDRFGLPIPANVLREEEEEEDEARGDAEATMTDAERENARAAFRAVEHRVLDVVNSNFSGLGIYLGDAFGW